MAIGRVAQLWRFPVKSFQGERVESLDVGPTGVDGDRQWALIDGETGKLMSAKRYKALLDARSATVGDDVVLTLPDGTELGASDAGASDVLSRWLGRDVELRHVSDDVQVAYEMTFEPPNDDAEYIEIPAPAGSFLDLAPVHLLSTATLAHAADTNPELDWDVRRFRPNVLVELDGSAAPFTEDGWTGTEVGLGAAAISVRMPTVRCAMPLRGQPGLDRQPGMYAAMEALHANHIGVYCDVARPGTIAVGEDVVPSA